MILSFVDLMRSICSRLVLARHSLKVSHCSLTFSAPSLSCELITASERFNKNNIVSRSGMNSFTRSILSGTKLLSICSSHGSQILRKLYNISSQLFLPIWNHVLFSMATSWSIRLRPSISLRRNCLRLKRSRCILLSAFCSFPKSSETNPSVIC